MALSNNAAQAMAVLLDRVERLEDEKKVLSEDIAEIWKEAKGAGYDTAMLKKAHSLRKLAKDKRDVLGIYISNLDLFS